MEGREGGGGIRGSRKVEMERCLILKSKHLTQHTSMTDETVDEVLQNKSDDGVEKGVGNQRRR